MMPSQPFVRPYPPDKRDSVNRNFPWFQGPPMSNAEAHARAEYQSPPPAPTLPSVAMPPSPELVSPRSQRAKEKQRAITPTPPPLPTTRARGTTLTYLDERDSIGLPPIQIVASTKEEQPHQQYDQSYTMQTNRNLCYPQQSARDPSLFHLNKEPRPQISAPVQPRVTDVRAHIERDPTYSTPTYEVQVTFKIKMQPGDLH